MKWATLIEVRPVKRTDGVFLSRCKWVAIDSTGRRYGGDTELEARTLCEKYNSPTHASKEKGRVSWTAR